MYYPYAKASQIVVFFNLQYLNISLLDLVCFCMKLHNNQIYILSLKVLVGVADNTLSASQFTETFNF